MNNNDYPVSPHGEHPNLTPREITLHCKLRQKTINYHAQIESAPLFKQITDSTITIDEYLHLLKKLYGYIAPCEILIHDLLCDPVLVNREKSLLLEDDLRALGVPKELHEKIPHCNDLPLLKEQAHVLGYLYVIEGSTLGGQVITKILQNRLKLSLDNGVHYFHGYGKNTKAKWHNFCQYLNLITDHEQQNKIIHSVSQTYQTLYDWVSNGQ